MSRLPVWKTRSTRSVLPAAALLMLFAAASGFVLQPRSVENSVRGRVVHRRLIA